MIRKVFFCAITFILQLHSYIERMHNYTEIFDFDNSEIYNDLVHLHLKIIILWGYPIIHVR